MGADGANIRQRRAGHAHERLADGQYDLSDDIGLFSADQRVQVVHHSAAHGILLGNHRKIRLSGQQIRNGIVHRLLRNQGFSSPEVELRRLFGVGAFRTQIGNPHALRKSGRGAKQRKEYRQPHHSPLQYSPILPHQFIAKCSSAQLV